MDETDSFEQELARLRKFVLKADDDALIELYFFYFENLSKLRFLMRTFGVKLTDLVNEQRWGILVNVCEVELKRRNLNVIDLKNNGFLEYG